MSAVKNLRAMFEQKDDSQTSPPDRGRSPGIPSSGTNSPSLSARPLSKVRTSFIAVEKDGRIGLRRDESGDSAISRRRLSENTEGETPPPLPDKASNIFAEKMTEPANPAGANDLASDPPRHESDVEAEKGAVVNAPAVNPDKSVDVEDSTATLLPADPAEQMATKNGALFADAGFAEELHGASGGSHKAKEVAKGLSKKASIKPAPKPVSVPTTVKATAPKSAPKPAATMTKAPVGPKATSKPSGKTAEKKTLETTTNPKPTNAPKAPALSTAKKPQHIQTTAPSGPGFVKPKPKSPTKPVNLPSSLMAPTASSVSKVHSNPPRQTHSRASGNAQTMQSFARSPSRASVSTVGTTATTQTNKNLKRQSSTVGRARPSLGPPPKPVAKDHPLSKKDKDVDEGFLARMMRPTQASSSKTADKTPITPPRKTTAPPKRPVTRDGHSSGKKDSDNIKEPVKKTVPRNIASPLPEKPAAEEIAPAVEQHAMAGDIIEMTKNKEGEQTAANDMLPVADQAASPEAIEAAKETEGTVHMPEEAAPNFPAQAVASTVEQQATAEGVIEAAKEAEGEVILQKGDQGESNIPQDEASAHSAAGLEAKDDDKAKSVMGQSSAPSKDDDPAEVEDATPEDEAPVIDAGKIKVDELEEMQDAMLDNEAPTIDASKVKVDELEGAPKQTGDDEGNEGAGV